MKGKILKVFNNDLYGKEDEREVVLFAAFTHKKYSNKYALFTFKEDNLPKKLYYGSIYLKEKAIVIFDVKKEFDKVVKDFIEEFKKQEFKEFDIIDPTNLEKAEIVNFNEMEFPDIDLIYSISFPKEEIITPIDKSHAMQTDGAKRRQCGWFFVSRAFFCERNEKPEHQGAPTK